MLKKIFEIIKIIAKFIFTELKKLFKTLADLFYSQSKQRQLAEFLIAMFLFAVVLIKIIQIIVYSPDYQVDFTKDNFNNINLPLYISEDPASFKFGESKKINGNDIPQILTSPLSFVWKPEEYPLLKRISISAEIQDQADWDISVVCPNCDASIKYQWQPFYREKLKDYNLLKEFPNDNVYIYTKQQFDKENASTDVAEWIKLNIPEGSNIDILDNSYPMSKFVNKNIDFKPGSTTTIDKAMRGPHTFYVYLKDNLDLQVKKQDLNWYDGPDEVTVTLYNLDNEVVYQNKLDDDEMSVGKGNVVSGDFEFPIYTSGVYKLEFKGNNDWKINSLKINTNKIVLTGTTLILDPVKLYTKVETDTQYKVNIWHESAMQTIKFIAADGSTKELTLGLDQLNYDQFAYVTKGEYEIDLAGDQYFSGGNFAFNKEQFFNPFIYNINPSDKSDFYMSNIKQTKSANGMISEIVPDKTRIQKLDNLKEIKFELKNSKLVAKFNREKPLIDKGYTNITTINDIKVWAKNKNANTKTSATDLTQIVKDLVPQGSTVYISSKTKVNENAFLTDTAPQGFVKSTELTTTLNFALRGTHEFYVFLDGSLNLEITKEDLNWVKGKDEVEVSLTDKNNTVVCKQTISDDGNELDNSVKGKNTLAMNCPNVPAGVYSLLFKGLVSERQTSDNDFVFKQLKINTNKIVIKNRILNVEPISLYFDNNFDKSLTFYYWHVDMDQIIKLQGEGPNAIELTTNDINKEKTITLSKGEKTLLLPKGDLVISGSNFSLNRDNWFNPYIVGIVNVTDFETDYKLIEDEYISQSYIPIIFIDIK